MRFSWKLTPVSCLTSACNALRSYVAEKCRLLERRNLEDEGGKAILQAAKIGKTVFLVPGDPFIATTHVTLRIDAEKQGIHTRIVHGTSIMSAIVSLSGLHNYKFGKTVTVPFPENLSRNTLQRYSPKQASWVCTRFASWI